MNIKILFFASLREAAGSGEVQMDVAAGTKVSQLWAQLSSEMDGLPGKVLCAVNQDYVDQDYVFGEDDHEVAFFPPVTGG
ncbi:MAG TPA: molybdopterin synthase sulfur carrier subunit [Gammaproteobacteria bacterium]|nr:molybdopterin synthase sulfur carrier subunit [Gammaproteobacteria bacterium]